jgi:hypothetical protein
MDMMRPVLLAVPPMAPTSVVHNAGTLTWFDNSLSETAFVVEKSSQGGPWLELARMDRPLDVANTTGQQISFVDDAYAAGDTYRVFAENKVGDFSIGFPSKTVVSDYAYPGNLAAPADPTNLVATLQAGPQVNLTWQDNSNNETGFTVERSTDNFVTPGIQFPLPANSTSFLDNPVAPGSTYYYRVFASNAAGPSNASNVASVDVFLPADPTGLTATEGAGPAVALSWVDNATNELGYVVERDVNGGGFTQLTALGANANSFVDTGVVTGDTYTYQVYAVNLAGNSGFSNQASVQVLGLPTAPVAPSGLSATNVTRNSLTLRWVDNSNNEQGFTIQMSTGSGFTTFTPFSAGANATSLAITNLSRNTRYYFRVLAFNAVGPSAWSPTFNVRTLR